jgi:hypothetical protein
MKIEEEEKFPKKGIKRKRKKGAIDNLTKAEEPVKGPSGEDIFKV